jgi:predicted component of type VI protein secretion system
MAFRLVALSEGPDIPLDGTTPIVVGRGPLCDARLPFTRVSRRHCIISVVVGAVEIRDLGSTNGTLINGRQVLSGRLRPGDVLSIAGIRYRLEAGLPTRLSWMIRMNGSAPGGDLSTKLDIPRRS